MYSDTSPSVPSMYLKPKGDGITYTGFILTTSENTHLLCKGKYHCSGDLLFDHTCKSLSNSKSTLGTAY